MDELRGRAAGPAGHGSDRLSARSRAPRELDRRGAQPAGFGHGLGVADALLAMARAFTGYTDATAATCTAADRYGLDLMLDTPRGRAPARVGYAEPVTEPGELRAATVELARRARAGAQAV